MKQTLQILLIILKYNYYKEILTMSAFEAPLGCIFSICLMHPVKFLTAFSIVWYRHCNERLLRSSQVASFAALNFSSTRDQNEFED